MWRKHIFAFLGFALTASSPRYGLAHAQQLLQEQEDPYEILKILHLDPVIHNALKVNLNDTLLMKLQRDRCFERATYLAKLHTLMEIGKYNPLDISEHMRILSTLPDNLLELMEKPEDRAKCHELRQECFKMLEKDVIRRSVDGNASVESVHAVKAARLTAEVEYLKFKQQVEKSTR